MATFTPDGWYKSGDIARRKGDYFFILGRASFDSKNHASSPMWDLALITS